MMAIGSWLLCGNNGAECPSRIAVLLHIIYPYLHAPIGEVSVRTLSTIIPAEAVCVVGRAGGLANSTKYFQRGWTLQEDLFTRRPWKDYVYALTVPDSIPLISLEQVGCLSILA